MIIETRHAGTRCGEPRFLRPRAPLVVLVLMALAAAVVLAPAAMAQSSGSTSHPLALLAVQQAELTASAMRTSTTSGARGRRKRGPLQRVPACRVSMITCVLPQYRSLRLRSCHYADVRIMPTSGRSACSVAVPALMRSA